VFKRLLRFAFSNLSIVPEFSDNNFSVDFGRINFYRRKKIETFRPEKISIKRVPELMKLLLAQIEATCFTGANPTTYSYNANAVKNYNATNSIAHLQPTTYNAVVVALNSKVVGLALDVPRYLHRMLMQLEMTYLVRNSTVSYYMLKTIALGPFGSMTHRFDASVDDTRSQSYDRELQRHLCKFLQLHG
jgi:hypothetical protein